MSTVSKKRVEPPVHGQRGEVWYFVGAVGLVVLALVVAVLFGVLRAPSLDELTDAQRADLPGGLTWTQSNDRGTCTDLVVASPDDGYESLICNDNLDRVIGWTDEGIFTISFGEDGDRLEVRDPSTGEVLSIKATRYDWGNVEGGDSDGYSVEYEDGVLTLADPLGQVLWQVEADSQYAIGETIVASPDGSWVAFTDSSERLLLVRSDGSEPPAVWATGLNDWSWADLVWEGTESSLP